MKILQALSGIKHNGEFIAAKTLIEAEVAQFENLIANGIVRVIDGAETIAEAIEVIAKENATQEESVSVVDPESQNTWGPTKEPIVAPQPEATKESTTETKIADVTTPVAQVEQPAIVAPIDSTVGIPTDTSDNL